MIRDEDGSPVLIDFGAARRAIGARSRSLSAIVTPGYAPIEQYESRGHQGAWTDIYALGAVCYRALTGAVPEEPMDRIRDDGLVPLAQRCAGQASDAFLSAIDEALAVHPKDRPQSIGEWREALEASVELQTRRQAKGEQRREQAAQSSPLPTPGDLARERERFVAEVGHKPSPDAVDDERMTDLHYVARLNLPTLALYLLSLGAAVDARNDFRGTGLTPLHYAALNDASATAEVLLRLGADVNAINDCVEDFYETPLHCAALNDASVTAEVLLRHGADIQAKDSDGRTPLHYTALNDALVTAEVLLRHGADIQAKNNYGQTPLDYAVRKNASSTAEVLRRYGGRK